MVIQKGKLVEQGTHKELIARPNGAYSTLVALQLQKEQADAAAGSGTQFSAFLFLSTTLPSLIVAFLLVAALRG